MKNYKKLIIIALVGSSSLACQRTISDSVGPTICPSANYVITSPIHASTPAVDFRTTDSVKITAELNEIVSWTVTITGQTSKAKKIFSGRSEKIDVTWYGEPSSAPFFIQETCTIDLTLACEDIVQSTSIDISKVSNLSKIGRLLWDFDNNQIPTQQGIGKGAKFTRSLISPEQSDIPLSPQGGKYIKLAGSYLTDDGWYYGYTGGSVSGADLAKLSTDPTKLFVNFYYNTNGKANTDLFFKVSGGSLHIATVGDAIRIKPVATGWTLISFPLSDLTVHTVSEIQEFSFSLNTSVQKQAAEANIDFVIVTKDKPLFQ